MSAEIPMPGNPVRGSKSGVPIMALLDLLGRSWALGIIWGLSERPLTFRKVQEYCETLSPTTLNVRLKELSKAGLIEKTPEGYQLTRLGNELYTLINPLGAWAKKWAKSIRK
jgi:DNA-binding HxlR family transcriptional regulator